MNRLAIPLACLFVASTALAESSVPLVLVHQGRLLDGSDHPAAGTHTMTFSLFPTSVLESSDPTPAVWSETYDVKVGTDGAYAVRLGDKGTLGAPKTPLHASDFAGPRWLAVRIDAGDDLTPRLQIGAVPYAILAANAEKAADVDCAGCVHTADVADGAITLAKLQINDSVMTGLNADLLDGLDSAAFAPAAIEAKVDAIQTSVGTGLGGAVSGVTALLNDSTTGLAPIAAGVTSLKTSLADSTTGLAPLATGLTAVKTALTDATSGLAPIASNVTAVKSALTDSTSGLAPIASNVTAVKAALTDGTTGLSTLASNVAAVKTSVGANANAKLDTILQRMNYSKDCKDSWVATAWGDSADATGYSQCLRDGRWHLVIDVGSNGVPTGLTGAQLRTYLDGGAQSRITTAIVNEGFDCERIEYRSNNRVLCVGPMSMHPGSGFGSDAPSNTTFHNISFSVDSDGRAWHGPYTQNSNGSAPVSYSSIGADASTWGRDWFAGPGGIQAKWWIRF